MTEGSLTGYRVLARKYRPDRFSELIGQESLVRTLSNALSLGRLAHAFVLTGVRGVGKTSTARLLARGLNCVGPDGEGQPTLEPCGQCEPCQAIAAGRHVDVLEIDAASHTGVDDAREIIDSVGYRPVSARYKIYVIDEVHMMSKSAFNALLKTLEEPPETVKFIFATTEIRKVPVTILSRCQRFDLRRVPAETLATHLNAICQKESIAAEEEAITAIARAAEGSVRDSLSLLDQAAAMTADRLTADSIAGMLGRPGRADAVTMLQSALQGDSAASLAALAESHAGGAEPEMIVADLMDLVHRASLQAAGGSSDALLEMEREPVARLAEMGIARLGRAWQMLLKGHGEVTSAPQPLAAAEMLLIRLAHLASMPPPSEIIRRLASEDGGANSADSQLASKPAPETASQTATQTATQTAVHHPTAPTPASTSAPASPAPQAAMPQNMPQSEPPTPSPAAPMAMTARELEPVAPPKQAPEQATEQLHETGPEPVLEPVPSNPHMPQSLHDISDLAEMNDEPLLAAQIRSHVRLVRMQTGLLDICLTEHAPDSLAGDIAKQLTRWTGTRWMVSLSDEPASKTIAEERQEARQAQRDRIAAQPLMKTILEVFPGAEIETVDPVDQPEEDQN